jgi:hypothetical protein
MIIGTIVVLNAVEHPKCHKIAVKKMGIPQTGDDGWDHILFD